jgi:DNA mismatch repair protein MutS
VVEQSATQPFVANDLELDDARRMLIITGPNMGGKSTYMRQSALIVILAYRQLRAGRRRRDRALRPDLHAHRRRRRPRRRPLDLHGRDDRDREHPEQRHAARLVLMDEIGRGTSTFDGLSLAWAAARHIGREVGAFTLFATHYFELTSLPDELPSCANVHLDATEHGRELIFLHAVKPGPANQSYGLHVAELAGIPPAVIAAARQRLNDLEQRAAQQAGAEARPQLPLFEDKVAQDPPAMTQLRALDPDALSPREALDALYRLKALLRE